MADIGSFLAHVLWNFWTVVAGFMISVEPVTRFFWHGYDDWAAKWLSAALRRRLARAAAVFAFVIANYLAFHDVSERLRKAQQSGSLAFARHLTAEERVRLASALSNPPISGQVEIMSTCDECEDYAQEFRDALPPTTGIKVTGGVGLWASASARGIKVLSPSLADRPPLALRFAQALEAAGLRYEWGEQKNLEPFGKEYLLVVIGRPWR
jgi:hypothetical protein